MPHTVQVPTRLTTEAVLNFWNGLKTLPVSDGYTFDFGMMRWVEPFPLLFFASQFRRLMAEKASTLFQVTNHQWSVSDAHGYAAHMGFFKALGVDYGNAPGQAKGNPSYIPITPLDVNAIKARALATGEDLGDLVDAEAKQLSQILLRVDCGDLVDVVHYSLREIMRNVCEHSEAETLHYCAQYWPTKNEVEVSLLDNGIGIRASLQENPHLTITSDEDALKLALMPGVSGKAYAGIPRAPYAFWQNSGYGLYMINRITANDGVFVVCSGDTLFGANNKEHGAFPTDFKGTAIRMRISTLGIEALKPMLNRFKEEGEAYAKTFGGTDPVGASVASLALRRDFQPE